MNFRDSCLSNCSTKHLSHIKDESFRETAHCMVVDGDCSNLK